MKILKNTYKMLLVLTVCITSIIPSFLFASAQEPSNENLALNRPVTASAEDDAMPASYLTDADENSRWSSEKPPIQWAYVDLGETKQMNYFSIIWESSTYHAEDYNIYVSDTTDNWGTAVVCRTGNDQFKSEEWLSNPVSGRYVKLEITKQKGYPNVSCRDFKVKYMEGEILQDPLENIALGKSGVASSIETNDLNANKLFDGDTSTRSSRWSTDVKNAPHWVYVDLRKVLDVKTIRLFWETRKATAYKIQVADTLSEPMVEEDWTTVKTFTDRPPSITEKIVLDSVVKTRYVRLYIDSATSEDPDGGVTWNTVSLYEMEIYGGQPKENMSEVGDNIQIVPPVKGDTKLEVKYPETEDYEITYNGTDYEQVVDTDLTIYEPVVDTSVIVSFKLVDKETGKYIFKEIQVLIPGTHKKETTDNKAPNILPELREWKGRTGNFVLNETSRVVIKDESLRDMAKTFAKDYEEITGKKLSVATGNNANAGEFYFTLTEDTSKGLKEEGYSIDIDDVVSVEAETPTGAFWATRTLLQSIKSTNTIPKGITRDYPLYKVRGFILDVGRKTFTLDYLQQIVKQMSWYKMNDFQVHLNDNLIQLENYSAKGWDPMTAYSGFRLESNIKKGGNNGLNQADLTSTDVFYTKDEFRSFIKDSRIYGVNIVPEIDTPAHSLALTKVRPDLRHGTYGRDNDHLNLTSKYDESIGFVQDIFNEYMGENLQNPIFDKDTIIHIGADEYNANHEAYRKFSDDMLKFVQDTGRKARIWGSLTVSSGSTPVRSQNVEMNLWNFGYANMDQMYEEGYDLINCNDSNYYVVPNAGYYGDYLPNETLYNLAINSIGGVTIPAGDKQMVGGAFAVWNDMTDYLDNGVSEYDVYDRIRNAIPLFGSKLWGKGDKTLNNALETFTTTGSAPGTNFGYEIENDGAAIVNYPMDSLDDISTNGYTLTSGKNAQIVEVDEKNALYLEGKESYLNTELTTIGLDHNLRVKVKRISSSKDEQILFESSYGSIKAVQKETGKVGFSRERFDYSFNYELPVNEWIELEIKNKQNKAYLYVNGELVDILGDGESVEGRPLLATTMIPFERIGSKTNAFHGYIDDIRLGVEDTYHSTMALDYVVWSAKTIVKEKDIPALTNLVIQAEEVFKEFAPDTTKIQSLTDQITAIINSTEFKKADYSRINIYLSIVPKDVSLYTELSVARLQQVIDSIRQDLPVSMQSVVDSYEKQLEQALQNLILKDGQNMDYISNARLTATASSYQDASSSPSKAIDDNLNTMWHSKWSITTMPHWIDLEIDTPEVINGLTYVPRPVGSTNGVVTKYEIHVSDNGTDYTKIKDGTLPKNNETKVITFDSVTTKHVRLVFIEAGNNNGSASEIKLHLANVEPDITGLQEIINKAETITNLGFTDASWKILQDRIAEAKALIESNPNANDVESMKRDLQSTILSLQLKEKVDTSSLEELLVIAKSIGYDIYTTETVTALKKVIKEVEALLEGSPSKEEVETMITKLQTALDNLKLKNTSENLDTEKLKDLIAKAEKIDRNKYTDISLKAFDKALTSAKDAMINAKTQKEIDDAYLALLKAIGDLESKGNGSIVPNPGEEQKPGTSTLNQSKTGDTTSSMGLIIVFVISGIILFKKKEEVL